MKHSAKSYLEQRGVGEDVIIKIEKLNDMQMRGRYSSAPVFSDFIDPETLYIAKQALADQPQALSFGGYEDAEYQQVSFCAEGDRYFEYPITLLCIQYQVKFGRLEHKDVLGALMSMGLVREKFGDIFLDDGFVYVFVCDDIADYVIANLTKIKKQGVKISKASLTDFIVPQKKLDAIAVTVASLRLDVVIAAVYKMSRSQAVNLVNAGEVKCNYSVEKSVNRILQAGDLLSVRRKGRFYLDAVNGLSKKGKLKLLGRQTRR